MKHCSVLPEWIWDTREMVRMAQQSLIITSPEMTNGNEIETKE